MYSSREILGVGCMARSSVGKSLTYIDQLAPIAPGKFATHHLSGRPVYVHRNGLANTRLKYSINFSSFSHRSRTDLNDPRRITFRMITPNTSSIWFNHELCFGV